MNSIQIRDANNDDAPIIQAIYAEHVIHGLASWEEIPPNTKEISQRMAKLKQAGFPYRAGLLDGEVCGYAYANIYRPRSAYRYTVENSIYVAREKTRLGLGGALLSDLIEQCTQRGYRQMVAVIGGSQNNSSIGLHAAHKFKHCGILKSLGYKKGQWIDQVLMQLPLGESDYSQP